MHLRGLLLGLVLACLGASCTEDDGTAETEASAQPVPPFSYSLYITRTQLGLTPIEGSDVLLARRPEHLEHIYQQRKDKEEAKHLFGWLESQFHGSGVAFANVTALACGLDLPIRCTPDWQFIDQILGHSDGPGARHLRQVLADAFSRQARKRRMDTTLALAIVNAVLTRGQLKSTLGKATVSAETRAATGPRRLAVAEAAAAEARWVAALEKRAAAVGAERLVSGTGRLRAPADVSAIRARLVEAEALEAGSRQTAALSDLAQLRPSLQRPPAGASASEALWRDYVTYWERRFGELSGPEAPSTRPLPPLTWEGYRRFRTRFERAFQFQRSTSEMLRRKVLGDMERPRLDENVGLKHEGNDSLTYVDQLVVDEATLAQGTPRVESFSTKQRDFTRMNPDAISAQIRVDAREALVKYGGTVEVRRPDHPLFERQVTVSRVHLIYDERLLPDLPLLAEQMAATAKQMKVGLHFHHEL